MCDRGCEKVPKDPGARTTPTTQTSPHINEAMSVSCGPPQGALWVSAATAGCNLFI